MCLFKSYWNLCSLYTPFKTGFFYWGLDRWRNRLCVWLEISQGSIRSGCIPYYRLVCNFKRQPSIADMAYEWLLAMIYSIEIPWRTDRLPELVECNFLVGQMEILRQRDFKNNGGRIFIVSPLLCNFQRKSLEVRALPPMPRPLSQSRSPAFASSRRKLPSWSRTTRPLPSSSAVVPPSSLRRPWCPRSASPPWTMWCCRILTLYQKCHCQSKKVRLRSESILSKFLRGVLCRAADLCPPKLRFLDDKLVALLLVSTYKKCF